MTAKSVLPIIALLLLYFVSGCKKDYTPKPQSVKVSYIEGFGELGYEGDLLTFIGGIKLFYDDQRRLTSAVTAWADTLYNWYDGTQSVTFRDYYKQYGFIWKGTTVHEIRIDSAFSHLTFDGEPFWHTYRANIPLASFFRSENRIDSIIVHQPSDINGFHRILFEYDQKQRIVKKTTYGIISPTPHLSRFRFLQIDSSFEYDNYHNPYHLLSQQLGTPLPELLTENFSPNNPTKYTTYYKEGTMELTYDVNCSYTYSAQRYPTQITTVAGSGLPSIKALSYK